MASSHLNSNFHQQPYLDANHTAQHQNVNY